MTSPESVRANPARDILEVFGAIDRAVLESNGDPDVLAAADQVLPGSAANPGWYAELVNKFFPGDDTRADLVSALTNVATYDADTSTPRLTRAQTARLLYGISALARLQRAAPRAELGSFDAPDDSPFGEALIGSLATVVHPEITSADDRRAVAAQARNSFLDNVASSFTHPGVFDSTARATAVADLRDGSALQAPLCQTAVVMVDGYESVVVDTKFADPNVTLDRLKAIVNPFNWSKDYPQLFVNMTQEEPDILPDRWRRVLETVNLLGPITARTPLKFFPYQDPDNPLEAEMNYDLDTSDFGAGDGQVRVDRGFINLKSTATGPGDPGVLVKTRKVVHIQGISAFAQARLVCIGGYGTGSVDFLIGAANSDIPDLVPFDYPTNEDQADTDPHLSIARATATTHFVPAAVDAWTECVQDLSNGYFDVTQKWLSGSLTLNDLAAYTAQFGGELASTPWKYLQAMTTPRSPGRPGGTR